MSFSLSCQKIEHKTGRTLSINIKEEPPSLDPRRGSDMVGTQFHFMLFEGLMRLNSDFSITHAQAKSYEISPDGKTYTFHLRECKWSDGTPVIANDFEETWKDLLDPRFPAPDAYLLFCIKNAELAKKGEISLSEVGIKASNAKTLVVELERPTPAFLQIVSSSTLLPINHAQEKKCPTWASTAGKHFVCNGPFKIAKWKHNHEIILQKNKHFHNVDEVSLDYIHSTIIDNEIAVLHMYASGCFDLIGAPLSPFPITSHEELIDHNLLHIVSVAGTKFCAFNTSQFPFNNLNIRKAFALAVNRKTIVDNLTQLKEEIALSAIPPVLRGHKSISYFKDNDAASAREYFQKGLEELEIRGRDLGKISFIYWKNELNHMMAQELQQQWLSVLGVAVELESIDFKRLHEKNKTGDYHISLMAWMAEYNDPMNILERFRNKTNHRNYSKWENAEYIKELEKSEKILTTQEYQQVLERAEEILMEEMPFSPLFHWNYAFLVQPYVEGFSISPMGNIHFDKISLNKDFKLKPKR